MTLLEVKSLKHCSQVVQREDKEKYLWIQQLFQSLRNLTGGGEIKHKKEKKTSYQNQTTQISLCEMLWAAAVSFQIRAKREGIQRLPTRFKSVPYLRWSSSRLSLWSSWKTRNSWKRKESEKRAQQFHPHPRLSICNRYGRTLVHPLCEEKSWTHSGVQQSL